jgi:HPr kinase/phosphorylase
MPLEKFSVLDLLQIDVDTNKLELQCIAGKDGLVKSIEERDINRPGLSIGGFFEFFAYKRIQIFGRGESIYLKKLINENNLENLKKFFEYDIPCCIFSYNEMPPEGFLDLANKYKVPILITNLNTGDVVASLFQILGEVFAKKTTIHGVLVEVFGIGILLKGKSGIGKSETALELIERGHRLVADDTIELKNIQEKFVEGKGTRIISHHMEIRGIGIINVKSLYGIGSIRTEKKVQLVIELEEWDPKNPKEYDRIGLEEKYIDLLGLKIPYILMPVMPGRNIPIIIETAAMNFRLKMSGINAAKEFNKELMEYLETEEIKNTFFNLD